MDFYAQLHDSPADQQNFWTFVRNCTIVLWISKIFRHLYFGLTLLARSIVMWCGGVGLEEISEVSEVSGESGPSGDDKAYKGYT